MLVAKYPIVEERIPELNRLSLVSAVRCFWLQNRQHLNILWMLIDSNCVLLSQGAGVDDGGTDGRLETLWCTICRVHIDRVSTELLWSVLSLCSVVGSSVADGGRGLSYATIGREGSVEIDSSSDGMTCDKGWISVGVIIKGRPEGVVIGVDLLDLN